MADRSERRARRAKVRPDAPHDGDLERILQKISQARNIEFRNYKRATLFRRIERRMHDRESRTLAEYSALLDRDPSEYDLLIGSMLIKVTSFFRDAEAWEELSTKSLPQLLADKRPGEDIRAWSAGSCTGEEAFSLAIALAEAMGPSFHDREVKIFGTDVDEKAVGQARRGHYLPAQVESVPPRLLREYFVEENDGYTVRKDIRRNVVFGVNNLVSDAPISRLDVLLCRNVFIYLDAALQKRVLTRFHFALRRNGILMLGKSELIPYASRIYEPVDVGHRIYRKDVRRESGVAQERLAGLERETLSSALDEGDDQPARIDPLHGQILHTLSLPVVAISLDGTVTFWSGAAAALWMRPEADVMGKNLAALELPGLSGHLLADKTRAVREGASERETSSGLVSRPGSTTPLEVDIEVSALPRAERRESRARVPRP